MRVFLTGGSGLLGRHLISEMDKREIEYLAPSHEEFDINNPHHDLYNYCWGVANWGTPDVVIHCAAIPKYRDVEANVPLAMLTNVGGTLRLVQLCMEYGVRFVYISTDHVFDGKRGRYSIDDPINPQTNYAKSKAAAELLTRMYDSSLSIRTSFCPPEFPFDTAYTDKWTSQDYVDKIAPLILDKALSEETGVCHVGHPRRSFYELAQERNSNIKPGSVKEIIKTSTVPILIDTSFSIPGEIRTTSSDDERRNVAVDFDGPIHKDSKGYFDGTVYDDPVDGVREALKYLSERWRVVVFTTKARSDRPLVNGKTGIELIWEWLKKHELDQYVSDVTSEKPRAVTYIDDKAIWFENWSNCLDILKEIE